MTKTLLTKMRTLSQLLLLSAACNILMFALVIYWYVKERPPTPLCEKKPISLQRIQPSEATLSNQLVLQSFQGIAIGELLHHLHLATILENGFTYRDLALGYLITEHHFDINRAFAEIARPSQPRRIFYKDTQGQQKELHTYADLKEHHFLAAIAFGTQEKWPLTSKGLFALLQNKGSKAESSLNYAFYLTPEFMAVELLFKRSNENIAKEQLLQMLVEGSWETLSQFATYQLVSQDLSDEQRRKQLMHYVAARSPAAAAILLKTDTQYAIQRLDDHEVTTILSLLEQPTPDAAKYALTMLTSPRSDSVWKAAAERLYHYTEEPLPSNFDKSTVLKHFFPQLEDKKEQHKKNSANARISLRPTVSPARTIAKSTQQPQKNAVTAKMPTATKPAQIRWKRGYTVKQGDTLWKISQLFRIDVKELKAYNQIQKEELTPGTMIIVP